MDSGIDDGDIMISELLPPVTFGNAIQTVDFKTLYRALFAFYDPWVRAYVLRQALAKKDGLINLNREAQNHDLAVTFRFMHEGLQRFVMNTFR